MQRTILFFLITIFLSSSCLAEDLKEEISQVLKKQNEAWNKGDLDGYVRPYDDSGDFVFVSSTIIRSPQKLKERYELRYKAGEADFGEISVSELEVQELAPGLARAWGRWKVAFERTQITGLFTLILQKKAGQWRIIHDHSN
jgi:uncharacterized protein (TIGR02246 family)